MSQIKTSSLVLATALSLFIMALSGCGGKNSNVSTDSTGKHPANWVQTHWVGLSASDLGNSSCTQCHGPDLLGGIAKVSCFSASFGTQTCHAEGPGVAHATGWSQPGQHGRLGAMAAPSASAGFFYCTRCHGSNFQNGTAVSCYQCHTTAPHPAKPWHGTTASGTNHVFTDPGNADQCAKCHAGGANLTTIPAPPAQPAGTAPGCFNNTLCHGSGHSAGWSDPTSANFHSFTARISSAGCVLCHGATLDGGTAPSGAAAPSCSVPSFNSLLCHSNGKPTGSKATGCTSCHGNPPDGATFPNILGSHDIHGNIPVVTCSACHNGAGTGTSLHANGTPNVLFLPLFTSKQANGSPVTYNANGTGTCTNVSCHGGLITPAWGQSFATGLTNGECDACHVQGSAYQVPEYNSYYSGTFLGLNLHAFHLAQINPGTVAHVTCTNCHDNAKLNNQQHFGGLVAHTFVFPGNTVGGINTRIGSYDTSARTCSTVSCHSQVPQSNISWFNF